MVGTCIWKIEVGAAHDTKAVSSVPNPVHLEELWGGRGPARLVTADLSVHCLACGQQIHSSVLVLLAPKTDLWFHTVPCSSHHVILHNLTDIFHFDPVALLQFMNDFI